MTTMTVDQAPLSRRCLAFVALHGVDILLALILGFVLLCGYAGAFQHMHDWTREAVPSSQEWQCWANAVISELMPTASFLLYLKYESQGRGTWGPRGLLLGSSVLSLCAQLSATGLRFLGDTQLLACLPLIAIMILGEMILSNLSRNNKVKKQAADAAADAAVKAAKIAARVADQARTEAEQRAEQVRVRAEQVAEQAAEQEAEQARLQREHDAEQARLEREASSAERLRLAELEAAERRRREDREAAERTAERDRLARIEDREAAGRRAAEEAERVARLEIERETALTRAHAEADALRVEAEAAARKADAEAERLRAETVARETETKIREQAVSLVAAGRHSVGEGSGSRRQASEPADFEDAAQSRRRPRTETVRIVEVTLLGMPAGSDRAAAVKAVAAALDTSERYARKFVPEDWTALGSVEGGEVVPALSAA